LFQAHSVAENWPSCGHTTIKMILPEQIAWTRDILERLYDIPYLRQALESFPGGAPFRDARDLQSGIIDRIQLLKPSPDVAPDSLAWRVYSALDLRYVRGQTQVEAATELNISLRQLRREQDRGIEAIATLLLDESQTKTTAWSTPSSLAVSQQPSSVGVSEFLRLDDLLHSVLSLIDPLLTTKNIHVQVRLPAPTPVFWTNRSAIRQVLIMLISTIIREATGGAMEVIGKLRGDRLRLELCKAHLVMAQPASQNTEVPDDDRTTLAKLARDAGIDIKIDSHPDDCNCIELFLPVSSRQRVLLVDDSADNIALTERFLAKSPYDLVTVLRAEDALLQAQTLQPSCIILDVMMPGRDGWEILALLKSHPETIHIPVVVCSVLRNQDLARALGATATLPRPHTPNQLLETLHSVIA
jgi:CheY-like chemotaxis protein